MNGFWDRLGISTSILCVAHCLLTPLLIAAMPLVGATLARGWFHDVIVAIVIPVAVFALWTGYRRHGQSLVLWLGAGGFVFIGVALGFGEDHNWLEVIAMVTAGLFLSTAHFLNLRARI